MALKTFPALFALLYSNALPEGRTQASGAFMSGLRDRMYPLGQLYQISETNDETVPLEVDQGLCLPLVFENLSSKILEQPKQLNEMSPRQLMWTK